MADDNKDKKKKIISRIYKKIREYREKLLQARGGGGAGTKQIRELMKEEQ